MHRTVVLNVVGLTPALLGTSTPSLLKLAKEGAQRPLATVFPAVTCSVQASLVTGRPVREHGCVANGWYFRDLSEVWLWRQSNRLVEGEKVWEMARKRDPAFTCAQLFWWYNMYGAADFSVTPRPIYLADGLKVPDIYTAPQSLHGELTTALGSFPLFDFWGPKAGIRSSEWIARCALEIFDRHWPSLTLVYLPHLDYDLQRFGPDDPRIGKSLSQIDAVCGEVIAHVTKQGARVVVVSEYGITPVTGPVHINRILREAGLIAVRNELGLEKLDPGASEAFAVADHQIAHVYVRRPERIDEVRRLLQQQDGIEAVLDERGKRDRQIDHPRSGELVAVSKADRWFSYYYWLDDALAPEYARTVDIHRKPGYDPAELFVDPTLRMPALKVGLALLKKKLGFRYLMDVIGLDAGIVKGSHGRLTDDAKHGPLLMTTEPALLPDQPLKATDFPQVLLDHLFADVRFPSHIAARTG
jgi:predicted AlkP superfamily pyrophosphatase or phosphodiesterase